MSHSALAVLRWLPDFPSQSTLLGPYPITMEADEMPIHIVEETITAYWHGELNDIVTVQWLDQFFAAIEARKELTAPLLVQGNGWKASPDAIALKEAVFHWLEVISQADRCEHLIAIPTQPALLIDLTETTSAAARCVRCVPDPIPMALPGEYHLCVGCHKGEVLRGELFPYRMAWFQYFTQLYLCYDCRMRLDATTPINNAEHEMWERDRIARGNKHPDPTAKCRLK